MTTHGTPTGYTNGCHGEAECANHKTGRTSNLLLEIDYTPFDAACRDPLLTDRQELVLCRRQVRHEGEHATRRGIEAIVWPNTKEKAA